MKLNKQILEAVSKGVKLALDDFDFNDDIKTPHVDDVINDDKYLEMKIRFNKLAKSYENLTKEQLKELSDLHYKYGFTYKVHIKEELSNIISVICLIDEKANLNWIDVSNLIDLSFVFLSSKFIGDISEWNVSNANNMQQMFSNSVFNGDISKWDVSNVTNMSAMFMQNERFDRDISDWDVSNVIFMDYMFYGAKSFKQDISKWRLHRSLRQSQLMSMFKKCPISNKHKPLELQ